MSVPPSFPGEKAEAAMAVLPLLLQGKLGVCKCTDFVEFISVVLYLSSEHLKVGVIKVVLNF